MANKVLKVALSPLVEVLMVAILKLWRAPLVERLEHKHHTHLVASLNKLGSRHIVRCADSIAAHILQHADLSADSSLIRYRAERSEIMVVADTFKYSLHSIKEEALIRPEFYGADSESCFNLVNQSPALIYPGL